MKRVEEKKQRERDRSPSKTLKATYALVVTSASTLSGVTASEPTTPEARKPAYARLCQTFMMGEYGDGRDEV